MPKPKKPKQEVTAYSMSIHFGVCTGPVDYMSGLIVDEKDARDSRWPKYLGGQQNQPLYLPDLFGGEKKEGGLVGMITWLPGAADQVMPENLAQKFDRTSATMPAYRGIASLFFWGVGEQGFVWRWNTPYLPGVWVEVARASEALEIPHARIYRQTVADLTDSGIDLGLTYGNDTYQWDTYGNYAVNGEAPITIWPISGGTARTIAAEGAWFGGGTVHLTDTGELVVRQGGGTGGGPEHTSYKFYDPVSLDVTTTIDLHASIVAVGGIDRNYGFLMDDITIAGDNWSLSVVGGSGEVTEHQPWILMKNKAIHGSTENTLDSTTAGFTTLSMGREYAYWWHRDSSLGRISWDASGAMAGSFVSPPGISGSIRICHYFEERDEVVIVCDNGNIYVYSPDLSTLLRSRLGTSYKPTDATLVYGLVSKRMRVAPGQVGLLFYEDTGYRWIYHFAVSTLALVRTIDIQATGFVNQGISFAGQTVGFNDIREAVFVGKHAQSSAIWYTASGPFDSNPAHIIFDALTNLNWGMGAPESSIDVASFTVAGVTLYNERFGLSMIWTQQASIEDFISEILDHIEATLFVNPRTGLLTLKLIRKDYVVASLPTFTPDNSIVTNFSRKLWGETINEIVVTWTNPSNEEEETVVAQDLANIESQGGIVSDSRNYYGVRRKDLAMRLAQRDLRSASTPLAKCDMEINRSAWDLLPGECCKLDSPEDGINQIVMRVGPVDYGKPGDSTVRVSLVEDVFSLALADYTDPPATEWTDPAEDPSPADHAEIVTLPYFVVVNVIDASVVAGVAYPEVIAGVLAAEAGFDTDTFELYGETTNAAGSTVFARFGTKSIASYATLPAALDAEVETVILSFPDRTQGNGPVVGGLMIIQGGDETESELCLIADLDVSGYTFWRGVLDTVPRAWPAGTPVWFIDESMDFADDLDIRAAGETVNYKVAPSTSRGTLAIAAAPTISETMTARPHLPLRPSDVLVNGDDGFAGIIDCIGVDPIPVTWARRNRETETAIVKKWDDGDITPEAGQTTTVTLTNTGGAVLHTYTGVAGTSQNVAAADFAGEGAGYVVVSSERDGINSLQAWRVLVQLTAATPVTVAVTGVAATGSVGVVSVATPGGNTTFNPSDKAANVTLSGGNLTATNTSTGSVRAIESATTGKYYCEFTITTLGLGGVGFANASAPLVTSGWANAVTVGADGSIYNNDAYTGINITSIEAKLVGIAIDFDNKKIWFRLDASGNWNANASYSPATNTGGIDFTAILSTGLFPYAFLYTVASSVTANFGDTAFTGTVPSGFIAGFTSG